MKKRKLFDKALEVKKIHNKFKKYRKELINNHKIVQNLQYISVTIFPNFDSSAF